VRAGRIARVASVALGAVRTTLRFLRHDPPHAREIHALRRETRNRLLGVLPRARGGQYRWLLVPAGIIGIVTRPRRNYRLPATSTVALSDPFAQRSSVDP
jgi:hypothetical protein